MIIRRLYFMARIDLSFFYGLFLLFEGFFCVELWKIFIYMGEGGALVPKDVVHPTVTVIPENAFYIGKDW